jgi:hypothetical protein
MRILFRTALTLFVGVLSAALAVIFQDDIAYRLGRSPVVALVEPGPWHPYPSKGGEPSEYTPRDRDARSRYGDDERSGFARIRIRNQSGRSISNAVIVLDSEFAAFDAALVRQTPQGARDVFISRTNRIEVGAIPAADSRTIYVWNSRTFGYPFFLDDISIYTEHGAVPIRYSTHAISKDGYRFLGISETVWMWTFIIALIIVVLIISIVAVFWERVARAFLKSEDFYLEQKVKFDTDPQKYTLSEIPKELR